MHQWEVLRRAIEAGLESGEVWEKADGGTPLLGDGISQPLTKWYRTKKGSRPGIVIQLDSLIDQRMFAERGPITVDGRGVTHAVAVNFCAPKGGYGLEYIFFHFTGGEDEAVQAVEQRLGLRRKERVR